MFSQVCFTTDLMLHMYMYMHRHILYDTVTKFMSKSIKFFFLMKRNGAMFHYHFVCYIVNNFRQLTHGITYSSVSTCA